MDVSKQVETILDANKFKHEVDKTRRNGRKKMTQILINNSKISVDQDEEESFNDVRVA
jgi:translation initiation factor IF-3